MNFMKKKIVLFATKVADRNNFHPVGVNNSQRFTLTANTIKLYKYTLVPKG